MAAVALAVKQTAYSHRIGVEKRRAGEPGAASSASVLRRDGPVSECGLPNTPSREQLVMRAEAGARRGARCPCSRGRRVRSRRAGRTRVAERGEERVGGVDGERRAAAGGSASASSYLENARLGALARAVAPPSDEARVGGGKSNGVEVARIAEVAARYARRSSGSAPPRARRRPALPASCRRASGSSPDRATRTGRRAEKKLSVAERAQETPTPAPRARRPRSRARSCRRRRKVTFAQRVERTHAPRAARDTPRTPPPSGRRRRGDPERRSLIHCASSIAVT